MAPIDVDGISRIYSESSDIQFGWSHIMPKFVLVENDIGRGYLKDDLIVMRSSIIDEQKANPFFYVRNQSIRLQFSAQKISMSKSITDY